MNLIKITLIASLFIVLNLVGYSQLIIVNTSNPIVTQEKSYYTFDDQGISTFSKWILPANCVVDGTASAKNITLKWKNVEASATNSTIEVEYKDGVGNSQHVTKSINPLLLIFTTPSFVSGAVKNIPCYVNTPVIIALNPYINTVDNGIDKDLEITSHFEWTLPSGWQTTTGQVGTFVSSSSISVIPPASNYTESISVRAKAYDQYSFRSTLQITRNLEDFPINGSTIVIYNSNYTYTAPSGPGVNYSWQLPSGWTGQSNGSSINVVAGCSTGNVTCTMTACNQTKTISLPITSVSLNPATTITGPSKVCSSGNTFSIANLPPVSSIIWTCGPDLTITSGQNTSTCTFSAANTAISWVKATLVTSCKSFPLPQMNVSGGVTASFTGNASVNYGGSGTWNATASGCTGPYYYQWWLREDLTPPVGAVMVGEEQSLTLMSVPRSAFAAETEQSSSLAVNTELSPSGPILRQPPTSTNYYLRLEAYDASGMRFDTQERLIIAYGNVDLINGLLRMPGSEAAQTSTLQMNISPNPAKDEATLEISGTEARSLENTKWQVELYDGAQMLKTKIQNIKGSKQTIRTAGWKEGVYIVRAKIGNDILTNKLVIKH